MKKKFCYLMLFLFIGGPILPSRGCKNMRKYRKKRSKTSYAYQNALIINQLNTKLS